MLERKTNPLLLILLALVAMFVLGVGGFFAGRLTTASAATTAATPTPTIVPTATPKIAFGTVVVKQIQSMARLQTTTYTLEQAIVREKPPWFLWTLGGQKLLLIVHGKVTVGVDLNKIGVQDIRVSEETKTAHITLPPVEIFDKFLVDDKTKIYDYDKGFLGSVDTKLIEDTRQQGLDQIVRAACADGVLERATKDAQVAMLQMLLPLGLQVEFEQSAPASCPVAPEPTAVAK